MIFQSTTNTSRMERRVRTAFRAWYGIGPVPRFSADFEHGQWWITRLDNGAQWSVVDASGPGAVDGFWFEKVTEGEDE